MRYRLAAALSCLILFPSLGVALGETKPYQIAVAKFDFKDTSGEPTNQDAKHSEFLVRFDETLNSALKNDGSFSILPVACDSRPCSLANLGLKALLDAAATTEAKYLLVGQIHKMSTLVGWTMFAVVEIGTGKTVCDRFLTYRGDTEEAWTRAAAGVARDIKLHCLK